MWGEHVHHGLWTTGRETPEEAAAALSRHVGDAARIGAGQRVVDVGCGYGATSRLLARERGARVTGLTLSAAQAGAFPPAEGVELLVRDWLDNGLQDGAFDAAIAVESLSHIPDKPRAFAELARVVRPGGRVAVVDWLTREEPTRLEVRRLLRPICEEGHLPSLHSTEEYAQLLSSAGFEVVATEDLSDRVWRTWLVVLRRLVPLLARDRRLLRELARSGELPFARSLVRIPLAYRVGSMRLGLLVAERRA